ncbi:MAG TPA: class I adenylate-forming enzyme family protein [Chthoniobacterales bacterium]|nr:class I adenylate-forming enzyme family protein [Chthoniobacterales bacterium]
MTFSDPLLAAWEETLHRRRHLPAVLDENGDVSRTFDQIEQRAQGFYRELESFEPGQVIAVQIGNHPDWPSIFLACLRRQAVMLPIDQSVSSQDRTTALDICRASGLVTASANGKKSPNDCQPAVAGLTHQGVGWGKHLPALLKLTSGTTAAPRAVRFRSEQLIADCVQICDTMGITEHDLNFGVIPISHSYGFSNLLTPLLVRGVPMALSSDRLPRAVVHNFHRSGATVFPGMPVFYQAFNEMADQASLGKIRLCISAGAPLTGAIAQQFRDKFSLGIHSFYGSSECGGICYDRDASSLEDGLVGTPLEGVRLERLQPDDGRATQIRVQSEAAGDGYFPEPDEAKLGQGRFTPDDLLIRTANGWKIVGRVSDLINVAGKKVNPAEVEAELLTVPGVREAIVFGRNSSLRHQEVAACVVASSGLSENDLLKMCRQRLSGWQVPKRIFLLDRLPVNERGKISRRELSARFAEERNV